MPDRVPWECPRCHKMIAPHVDEHECGPDGGVGAEQPDPPSTPPPAAVSMSHPWQWWSTTTSGTGSAVTLTFPPVKILAQEVMREMHRYQQRNAGRAPIRPWPGGGGGGGASAFAGDTVIVGAGTGSGSGGGGGGSTTTGTTTVHAHVHLDGKEIFRQIQRPATGAAQGDSDAAA